MSKASGLGGGSNWIVSECSKQLADIIHSVIKSSLAKSKAPID